MLTRLLERLFRTLRTPVAYPVLAPIPQVSRRRRIRRGPRLA